MSALWAWLFSAHTWLDSGGLLQRLLEHVEYSAATIAIAAAIAIPLGLWIGHTGRGRFLAVSMANGIRALPTLGILFIAVLVLGPILPGDWAFLIPSILVLVILAVPPILAGTYAGIEAVDAGVRDAARGMGMGALQRLFSVELPCALPLMFGGLRSATLQVIATATIAASVSVGGLGRFLIDGLAVQDYGQMAGGAVMVAVLALAADLLLAGAQRLLVSPGLTRAPRVRSRPRPADAVTHP